jgi:hypothetical protein
MFGADKAWSSGGNIYAIVDDQRKVIRTLQDVMN